MRTLPLRRGRRLAIETLEHRELLSITLPNSLPVPDSWQDLGTVAYDQIALNADGGLTWFRLTARQGGILSLLRGTNLPSISSQVVGVYQANASSQTLVKMASAAGRVDMTVAAGQTVYVCIPETKAGEQLWVANLVQIDQRTITILGTAGSDTIVYDGQGTGHVIVNQVPYALPSAWTSLSIVGNGGGDQVRVETRGVNEAVTLSAQTSSILMGHRAIFVSQASQLTINASASAVAEIIDSPGHDTVTFRPREGTLETAQFTGRVLGPQTIHAYARNGGNDAVIFYDSPDSDQASFSNDIALLRGASFFNRAKFFSSVTFVASTGEDTALLTGSRGADYLSGSLGDVQLTISNRAIRAVGFWTTIVRSGGGVDTAEVNDSPDDDYLFSFPGEVTLFNLEKTLRIHGFSFTHVYARNGGFDTAYFYDSEGDDRFVGRPEFAAMTTGPYYARVKFFEGVYAYSRSGGNDSAWLYDSVGTDVLTVRPYYTRLEGHGYSHRVETFSAVYALAGSGGQDRAEIYGSSGQDRVTLSSAVSDILFAETQTFVQFRRFGTESYQLDEFDTVMGQVSRATVRRGHLPAIINAADYYDPLSPTLGFQQAIDALPAEGGTVILPAGTFQLRQGLTLRSNVTLKGHEQGTTLARKDHAFALLISAARPGDTRLNVTSTVGFQVGDEITLLSRTSLVGRYIIVGIQPGVLLLNRPVTEGTFRPEDEAEVTNLISLLRAEGEANRPAVNITVENITLNGNLQESYLRWRVIGPTALSFVHTWNSVIRNVTVQRSPTSGIALSYGRDNVVEGCTVVNPRNIGIYMGWETDGIIRGNYVRGAGHGMTGSTWGEGILLDGGRDIRVENNLVEYSRGHGLHPAGTLTIGGIWRNNISRYNQGHGFHYCFNNFGVWTVSNQFYGNERGIGGLGLGGEYGDRFNVVLNNVIYENRREGIWVNGGQDNKIIGNILRNNSQLRAGGFAEIRLGEVWSTVIVLNQFASPRSSTLIETQFARLFNTILL